MSNLEFARAQARDSKIRLHGADAFAGMTKAGQLAAVALDLLRSKHVKPGVTTERWTAWSSICSGDGAIPAPLNYRGLSEVICTSVDRVVCHGIPGPAAERGATCPTWTVTLIVDGWHGDSSRRVRRGQDQPHRAAERFCSRWLL